MPTVESTSKAAYRIKADSVEACNCQHGCNCQFAGIPNEGKCEFIIGYDVKDGRVGDVSLNGLRFVVAAKYPKAIHDSTIGRSGLRTASTGGSSSITKPSTRSDQAQLAF